MDKEIKEEVNGVINESEMHSLYDQYKDILNKRTSALQNPKKRKEEDKKHEF